MVETSFLYDEEWEEQKKELQDILGQIEDPTLAKDVFVLETFVRGCAFSFVKRKPKKFSYGRIQQELNVRNKLKTDLKKKLFKIPVGVNVEPVPSPGIGGVTNYQDVPQYIEKVVGVSDRVKPNRPFRKRRRLLREKKTPIDNRDLIKDKVTGRVLASVDVADRYIVDEPKLDGNDLHVLSKIKKKRKIKNMDKGWKLIVKYGKKFKIQKGHETNIKYFVVNDIFGLGRIEPLLHDPEVTGVICDDYNKYVVVDLHGRKLETNIKFASKEELEEYVLGVAEKLGKKLNNKNTKVEGTLRGFAFFLDMGEDFDNSKFSLRRV